MRTSVTWANLGALSEGQFGESDIAYFDGHYYVVSTASYEGRGSTVMRVASTPNGIVSAMPFEVARGVYPSLARDPDTGQWHLYAEDFVYSSIKHYVSEGAPHDGNSFVQQPVNCNFPGMYDVQVRKHPTSGLWYAVGFDPEVNLLALMVADTPDGGSVEGEKHGAWLAPSGQYPFEDGADIFAGREYPAWAAFARPDPNLAFLGGHCYVLFTGYPAAGVYDFSVGYVEVDIETGHAVGDAVELPDPYPDWADGENLSDLNLVSGVPGLPDRIYGFGNRRLGYLDVLGATVNAQPPPEIGL